MQAACRFPLAAPDTLAGLPRTDVRLVSDGEQPAALVTYGQGLGAIVVFERTADARQGSGGSRARTRLPQVTIDGATGHELATALGTLLTVRARRRQLHARRLGPAGRGRGRARERR